MTAGALLSHYTTPAERLRGCVFAEGFESYDRVIQNGAVPTGAPVPVISQKTAAFANPTGYLTYGGFPQPKELSVSLWFKTPNLGVTSRFLVSTLPAVATGGFFIALQANGDILSAQYRPGAAIIQAVYSYPGAPIYYANNGWHHVVAVFNRTTNLCNVIVDGVLAVNGAAIGAWANVGDAQAPLTIGNGFGGIFPATDVTIKDVKLFNQALTTQEAQQLYAGNVYGYRRRMACYLPMGIAQHDPVNSRTLDVSGNNRHAVWVAGATAPTKISGQRGYSFDGGDYMTVGQVTTAGNWTVALASRANQNVSTISGFAVGFSDTYPNSNGIAIWDNGLGAGTGCSISDGAGGPQYYESISIGPPVRFYTVVSKGGAIHQIYRGEVQSPGVAGTGTRDLLNVRIGVDGRLNAAPFRLTGTLYYVAIWNEDLSPLQVADFYALQLQKINEV